MPRPWTPLLGSASDEFEGRRLYLVSAGLGAAASFAFAAWAHGFAAAMALRFLGGIAFAGVHMPGLKLLVDRVAPGRQARAAALYTSCYAVGSAASLLIAGVVDAVFGWRATFIAGGIGQLRAIGALALLPAAPARPALAAAARLLEFRPVLRNRAVMAVCGGVRRQHLGSVCRARLVCRLSRLGVEPAGQRAEAAATRRCRRSGFAGRLAGQHRSG